MATTTLPLSIFIISIFLSPQSEAESGLTSNLSSPKTSNNRSVYIDFQLRQCSSTITISSYGRTRRVQGSVLGTYILKDKTIENWPTWKMNDRRDRFLYKCPCGKKWLFGQSNGASEGWIKHPNCTDCPENCSRKWQYWNDDEKQWNPDIKISILEGGANDQSALDIWTIIMIIVIAAVLICSIITLCGAVFYHYSGHEKTVSTWSILTVAIYSFSIVILICIAVTYAYLNNHIRQNDFWTYLIAAVGGSWIVTFIVVPCCRKECSSESLINGGDMVNGPSGGYACGGGWIHMGGVGGGGGWGGGGGDFGGGGGCGGGGGGDGGGGCGGGEF